MILGTRFIMALAMITKRPAHVTKSEQCSFLESGSACFNWARACSFSKSGWSRPRPAGWFTTPLNRKPNFPPQNMGRPLAGWVPYPGLRATHERHWENVVSAGNWVPQDGQGNGWRRRSGVLFVDVVVVVAMAVMLVVLVMGVVVVVVTGQLDRYHTRIISTSSDYVRISNAFSQPPRETRRVFEETIARARLAHRRSRGKLLWDHFSVAGLF
ncbi:hypothetical protein G7Y89_g10146 [Cudoniella acicularis]|uniref:Uncharacterized protein n=1 Tax=Cudoniella acicularis TaxID=354080 RepID=A0A8H4W1X2_9HELO|nr:hypothetical protein G7Y89_g10146 [Cudoniella acicularis]